MQAMLHRRQSIRMTFNKMKGNEPDDFFTQGMWVIGKAFGEEWIPGVNAMTSNIGNAIEGKRQSFVVGQLHSVKFMKLESKKELTVFATFDCLLYPKQNANLVAYQLKKGKAVVPRLFFMKIYGWFNDMPTEEEWKREMILLEL